jgi:iron complex transport system substrate-binding protein
MNYIRLTFFCLVLNTYLFAQIEFYDQTKMKVSLDNEVKKVVTIPIPLASLSISVDKNISRLSSINPVAKEAIDKGILHDIFPDCSSLSTKGIGSNFVPNIEELLKLNPDLVFQWAHYGQNTIEPLKQVGLKVALLKYGEEELIQEWFEILGKAYNKEKRVDAILKYRQSVKNRLKNLTKDIKNKPKVLYFLRVKQSLRVAGEGSFNNYSINLSGGKNIKGFKSFKELGIEEILKYNPDVILLNNFESNLDLKEIYNHPLLSFTKAVKEKRVYKIPLGGTRWDPPGQESPLMWLWLFKLLHPDLAVFNLEKELQKAYKLLYDYDLNEDQMKTILHFNINKKSKYYKDILQ